MLELIFKFVIDVLVLLSAVFLAYTGVAPVEVVYTVFGLYAGALGTRRAMAANGAKPPPGGVITGLLSALLVRGTTK